MSTCPHQRFRTTCGPFGQSVPFATTLFAPPVTRLSKSARRLLIASASSLSFAAAASGQKPEVKRFTHVAIAPDGKRLAWIGPGSINSTVEPGVYMAELSATPAQMKASLPDVDAESES